MKDRYGKEIPLGVSYSNKFGTYTLVEYRSAKDVTIEWDNPPCRTTHQIVDVYRGSVKNPLAPSILGVACFGIGPHIAFTKDKKTTKSYSCWKAMIQRCYDEKFRHKWQSYADCFVCDEWLNYQTFADWYCEHYFEDYQLDKDILVKGNTLYGPDTCCFVPAAINRLFISNKSQRGILPIGVRDKTKVSPSYSAHCTGVDNTIQYLGVFSTPEAAFNAYKIFKENLIRNIAELYKDRIRDKVYNALLDWKIEQGD